MPVGTVAAAVVGAAGAAGAVVATGAAGAVVAAGAAGAVVGVAGVVQAVTILAIIKIAIKMNNERLVLWYITSLPNLSFID